MGEHRDRTAVNGAAAGDHAVAEERVGISRRTGQRAGLQKLPGSSSAWTRARALAMPFLSRLAAAFSPPGSLASSSFSRSSASSPAVVFGVGHFKSLFLLCGSILLSAWVICAPTLAMIGSSMAWMCSPPIDTTSRSATYSPQPPSGLRVA